MFSFSGRESVFKYLFFSVLICSWNVRLGVVFLSPLLFLMFFSRRSLLLFIDIKSFGFNVIFEVRFFLDVVLRFSNLLMS